MTPAARLARGFASLLACTGLAAAQAATFTVTSTADSGAGTLRAAVTSANASPGPDVIDFNLAGCPCTITLNSTIAIGDTLDVIGPGRNALVVTAANGVRPFNTASTATTRFQSLRFDGANSFADGGVIFSNGAVELLDVAFTGNTGRFGGAIRAPSVKIADSLFENNSGLDGGALWLEVAGVIQNTEFRNNRVTGPAKGGGAVYLLNGTVLTVTGSTFTGNASSGDGGAIHSEDVRLSISQSTFTANSARVLGGAISGRLGLELVDSTFSANVAGVNGGAVYTESDFPVSFTDTIFDANQAGLHGGALYQKMSGSLPEVNRSIFRNNIAGAAISTGQGGAAYTEGGGLVVRNSLLAGNTASSGLGHAVWAGGAPLSFVHVSIANGGSTLAGSAITAATTPIDFANSVVTDHATALTFAAGSVTPDRVLVWNTSGPAPAFVAQGAAMIDTSLVTTGDPLFVNPGGGDYHLGVGSAAVDLSPTAREASDYDGDSRPQGAGHDAGFDERAPGAQSITFAPLADRPVNDAPFAVSATASSGLAVTFSSSTPSVCTVSGATVTLLAVGNCTVAANQAGDAFWAAAVQVTRTFAVTKLSQSITFAALADRTLGDAPFGVTATASSGLAVTFSSTTTPVCTVSGSTVTLVATGTCTVAADQPGSTTYLAAAQVTRSFAVASPNPPRLANISTRMQVLIGADVLIGGFIIGGSQAKTVVVRARGPSLTAAGVPGALSNPLLQLFSGATQVAVNDNWKDAANQAAIQSSGFAPSNDLESAILTTLSPGAYTAIVSGAGGATGVGIIEVFEVDLPLVLLVNIATRGKVLTDADVMIGGFIIQGDGPQTVIVRARGPSLAAQGVPGTLQDPVLQIFSGQAVIASNDDWQSSPDAATIQASGFAPSDTRESVIRITLNPGAYTAIVTGKNGTTGVGIIEVFAQ